MKTLKELKDFIQLGQFWHAKLYHHESSYLLHDFGPRFVCLKNSRGIAFKTSTGQSYFDWPKRSELRFLHADNGDLEGFMSINLESNRRLEYMLCQQGEKR